MSSNCSRAPTSSVLYESEDRQIAIIDIPRSIEESQVHDGFEAPSRRLLSAQPVTKPFNTPEPRDGGGGAASASQQIADLMTAARVDDALQHITSLHDGPWHLPRVTLEDCEDAQGRPAHDQGGTETKSEHCILGDARYLNGSIQDQSQIFKESAPRDFKLMVIDPPWPNRSVRRKKGSYSTVSNLAEMRQLLSHIPVPQHLDHSGLVAVWITNKPAVLDFLTSPGGQFAAWGLEVATEWTWCKVTTHGEPIYPLDSAWRKPWEKLLIAKRIGAPVPPVLAPKMIFSVPDLHSRKPNLRGLFSDVLGPGFSGLEVFARHLTAGWWSWGDEVLRFQDSRHWTSERIGNDTVENHE